SWRFPGDRGDGSAIVIVNFRGPNLYAVGSAASELKLRDHPAGLPLPRSVTEPRYPADSMGQGTVALHLRVARSGAVERTTVLKGLGSLTQACSDAARQWKFNPARNITGDMIQSDVYAVCVFRQPVLGKP
ncbi:MAG: hypothetical protein FJW35_10680, partial [Acidobacteria bacterium]|nr:hypothetical protein [Acidobacteriota bacterium]